MKLTYRDEMPMLNGVMLLWFLLTAMSIAFVAIDIRSTPESPVLKWGFVLLTAYTGPVGAFLYVLGCREPLPGLHERYVAARWRQVLGSTMHCVAGDGIGILVGAVISSILGLHGLIEVLLEYMLGFAFGWTIFQALFMRDMAGGSYVRSLSSTFIPELLSMNLLMAGMVPTMMILRSALAPAAGPDSPAFWFVMSMALLAGLVAGGQPSQARNDDRPPCRHAGADRRTHGSGSRGDGRRCTCWWRRPRATIGNGPSAHRARPSGPGYDRRLLRCPCRRPHDRFWRVTFTAQSRRASAPIAQRRYDRRIDEMSRNERWAVFEDLARRIFMISRVISSEKVCHSPGSRADHLPPPNRNGKKLNCCWRW
jgi:uncharacterized protein DUF4396